MSARLLSAWFESLRALLSKAAASRAARYTIALALGEYILFGLLTELILLTIKPLPHYLLEDFNDYLRAYLAAAHGGDPYQIRSIGAGFLYPPPALLLVGMFALIPGNIPRAAVYISLNLLVLGAMLVGIAHHYSLSFRRIWWWYLLAFLFAPMLELLHVGQINLIASCGIFLLFLYEERLPMLAGFGLSLAICLKLTPLIFVVYLLVQRRWTTLGWTLTMLVVECTVSALFFGWQPLVTYIDVFLHLAGVSVPGDGNSQALGSLLNYYGWIAPGAIQTAQHILSLYLLIVFAASAAMAYLWQQREPLFLVLSLGMMVAPNIMWYHHYVFLLLPVFIWLAWSRHHPAVVLWCFLGLNIIQIDRWFLTRGGLAQLFVHLSILGILAWQISRALNRRAEQSRRAGLRLAHQAVEIPER
jgi:alpha-1,2-mannosyltransferase